MNPVYHDLTEAIEQVIPESRRPTPLHEPSFVGHEWSYVKECLDTGWVSSVGKYVDEFENKLAQIHEVKHAVAIVNGTAALQISLKLAGVLALDEVLIPALSFVATANAVSYLGAIPHFVDSSDITLGLDPRKLHIYLTKTTEIKSGVCTNKTTGRPIKAVVPMHTFGHPVDMESLIKVAEEFHLVIVEDAAESLGTLYKNKPMGSFGKLAALSFNGNKIVTTGGGGAILTNDSALAKKAKHLTTTAKTPHPWAYVHDEIGYNFRLPNINAALGCAQLESLPQFLKEKRALAETYKKAFQNIKGIKFFTEPDFAKSNYWLNVILIESGKIQDRDQCLDALHKKGILARPVWTLLHKLPMYQACPKSDLSAAEILEAKIINIPSSSSLARQKQ